jgi:nucleoside-diphosphate kinase
LERTLILVKPDGVRRGLIGEVVSRFERLGFRILELKMMVIDQSLASEHYAEHVGKPFYGDLVSYITSGPVVAVALEGESAVEIVRKVMGTTNAAAAAPGTLRGDFAVGITENLVHGSDSPESAARELGLFFPHLC